MNFLYKREKDKIIYLDDLGLEAEKSNLDSSIFDKFKKDIEMKY
ncbi:MAG: hypothetical protein Q9M97_05540 [Candidatus Gracilibacteria bacterium]|nr:hypothetical protein [Candidatus Gracilibacteria bacterium]